MKAEMIGGYEGSVGWLFAVHDIDIPCILPEGTAIRMDGINWWVDDEPLTYVRDAKKLEFGIDLMTDDIASAALGTAEEGISFTFDEIYMWFVDNGWTVFDHHRGTNESQEEEVEEGV